MTRAKIRPARLKLPAKADKEKLSSLAPSTVDGEATSDDDQTSSSIWSPPVSLALKLSISIRLCSALWSNVSDCDETYNYWEPLHMLVEGTGMQTWEYSPVYALRSYLYLWLHAGPLMMLKTVFPAANSMAMFYLLRCWLAVLTALAEVYLYASIQQRVSARLARYWFAFSIGSAGMYVSAAAFLPSSFSMAANMFAVGAWISGANAAAVWATAASALIGWPFAALLGLPIAIDLVVLRRELGRFLGMALTAGGTICGILLAVDSHYFGMPALAPLNIVVYNVFSSKGSVLYGRESAMFYVKNLLLNQSILLPLAAMSPLFLLLYARQFTAKNLKTISLLMLSAAVWLGVFFGQEHKEERFLFPVYPLVAFCAAFSAAMIESVAVSDVLLTKRPGFIGRFLTFIRSILTLFGPVCVFVLFLLSVSRGVSLYRNYHGSMEVYSQFLASTFDNANFAKRPISVCVGKEWHRFPSSFFLPRNANLRFIKSDFSGQLPKPYGPGGLPTRTRAIPTEMNDDNREEPSRYVDIASCNYLVDWSPGGGAGTTSQYEPDYAKQPEWEVVIRQYVLNPILSHGFFRAFYVPYFSEEYCVFGEYVLLKRK